MTPRAANIRTLRRIEALEGKVDRLLSILAPEPAEAEAPAEAAAEPEAPAPVVAPEPEPEPFKEPANAERPRADGRKGANRG